MALSELYELVSLQSGERPERIRRDNADMNSVTITLNNTFADDAPAGLVRKSCKWGDQKVSPWDIGAGRKLRLQFENECSVDGSRFLKPVARTNFAAENRKRSKTGAQKVNAAEGVRDVFGRILAVVAKTIVIQSTYIMFLAIPSRKCLFLLPIYSDGIPLKTDKATLTKILESKQETVPTDSNILPIKATVSIMLHETVLKYSKSPYAMMAIGIFWWRFMENRST